MLLGAGGRSTGSPSGSQSQALSHTAGGAAAAAAAAVPGCRRRLREKATTEPACRGGLIHCGRLSLLLAWCCWAAGATAAASGGTAAVPAGGRARTAACGRACCGLPSHTAAIGCAAGAAGAALPPGLLSAPQPGCTCWCAASRAQYRQAPGTHRKSSSRGPCGGSLQGSARRHQQRSVVAWRKRQAAGLQAQRRQLLARCGVPQAQRGVGAAACEEGAAAGQGQGGDGAAVACQAAALRRGVLSRCRADERRQVPQPGGAVVAASGQQAGGCVQLHAGQCADVQAVRGERHQGGRRRQAQRPHLEPAIVVSAAACGRGQCRQPSAVETERLGGAGRAGWVLAFAGASAVCGPPDSSPAVAVRVPILSPLHAPFALRWPRLINSGPPPPPPASANTSEVTAEACARRAICWLSLGWLPLSACSSRQRRGGQRVLATRRLPKGQQQAGVRHRLDPLESPSAGRVDISSEEQRAPGRLFGRVAWRVARHASRSFDLTRLLPPLQTIHSIAELATRCPWRSSAPPQPR